MKLAQNLGIADKIIWVDSVPHEEVPKYMNVLDCLVLPSLTTPSWKEQFGQVLVQAMACGVPVIGSSSGAIPEVIGDAGLVFMENDVEDLRKQIESLMGSDDLAKKLQTEGLKRARSLYSTEVIASSLASSFVKKVMEER